MADEKKTVIIDLKFDVSEFKKNGAEAASTVKKLKEEQKLLTKSGQETSLKFQENAAEIKRLNAVVAENQKAVTNLTIANKAQAGSNEQLKAQLSVMTLEYNKLSKEQRENSALGKELFANINQVTASLKGNEEAIGNNRRSVGDYAKALEGTPFGSFISGIKATAQAFLANPIGLILTAIVGLLALLKKAFTSNEEGSNKLAKAMTVLSGLFNKLLQVLEPLAKFIVNVVIKVFEDLAEKAEFAAGLVSKALNSLGFTEAAKGLDAFVKGIDDTTKAAQKLADAEAKLTVERREQRKIQYQAQLDAEKLRQIRDDESKSIDERIKANEDLGKVLEKQLKREQEIANLALSVAEQNVKINGKTTENLDKLAEAQFNIIDINERIAGQQSEQLANLNSLRRDEAAAAKERQAAATERLKTEIENNKKLIDLFILEQGVRAKGLDEELKIAQQVSDKKLAILEQERKKKLISETDFKIQSLQITQELEVKKAQILLAAAERELKMFTDANQSKLDANQFLNDAMYQQEIDRLEAVNNAQKEYAAKQLELGLISQQEYNDKINELNTANQNQIDTLAKDKKAADDAKKAEDLALQYEIDLQRNEDAFNLQVAELERRREAEILAADKTGADKKLIDEKYDGFKRQLELKQAQTTIGVAADTFGALASLAGDNAEAAKAFASFQAIMNATNSIISVLAATSTIPEPFGSVAKGIQAAAIGVTAFRNVQKINSTPVPKAARGYMGVFGGRSHSAGGTQGYFSDGTQIEVEKDELFAVVNKRNTSMLRYLNDLNTFGGNGNSFFAKGGVKSFANGGIGLSNVSTSVEQSQNSIDQLLLAVQSLPNPVVAVQDINYVQSDVNRVQARANL